MIWEAWPRVDDRGIARYVSAEAVKSLAVPKGYLDAAPTPENRIKTVEALYNFAVSLKINYGQEEYHPSSVLQLIRTPAEIVGQQLGTCLDLAAFFCGLCLRCELLPVLVVLDGHALAAVFPGNGLREWNSTRPGRALFDNGPLTDAGVLRQMIDEDRCLAAVECTGFAHSKLLGEHPDPKAPETVGRREDGTMTFDRAKAAGREQLDARAMGFAVDIAVAHYGWRVTPIPPTPLYTSFRESVGDVKSHIMIRQFQATIRDKTERFVGRKKLIGAIDARLAKPEMPSGYVVVRGEPGAGKSALMAHLIRERGYIHHFNIFNQRITSTRDFLENICAQTILRYELDRPMLPKGAGENSGPMVELLEEAVQHAAGNAIVVVVDALDESEVGASKQGANRLLLPESLPDGVFFLVTTREQVEYRLVAKHREDISFGDFKDDSDADTRLYIERFLEDYWAPMRSALDAWKVQSEEFVRILSDRAKGNFMYLVNVLKDIRDKKISKNTMDSIEKLPADLKEYYARHWRMMRDLDPDRFEKYYEPVVCILAAVREPIELEYVAELTKLSKMKVGEVIEEWRQFLHEDPRPDGPPVYSIYHASFQDFLLDKVGLDRYKDMIRDNTSSKIEGL